MVKLQLGAVCTKVQVIGSVMTCNPTEQVVLTISVVTLYVPAKLAQLSAGVLLPPHASANTEQAIPASNLAIMLIAFFPMA
jgi:hypothetical protein